MPAAARPPCSNGPHRAISCACYHSAWSSLTTRLPSTRALQPWRLEQRCAGRDGPITAAGPAPSDQPTADDVEEPALSLEEWLLLEAEAWDGSDEDTSEEPLDDDLTAATLDADPSKAAAQGASGRSASGGGGDSAEVAWAADLPYKLKPSDRRWDGQVPPDVVVIRPPRRDAAGNLVLPPGVQLPSGPPAASKEQRQQRQQRAPQQQAAQTRDEPQQQQPQRQRQRQQGQQDGGGRAGGRAGGRKQGGGRSGSRNHSAAAPAWMRNLPPSQ